MTVAVIVGSAFQEARLGRTTLEPERISTTFGEVTLYRYRPTGTALARPAYVLFRHGVPHQWLPNHIPYRAHAAALRAVGCRALLVTSSVGVMVPEIPLDQPLLLQDLLMLDNRLPDGSTCTIFPTPQPDHGHLVLEEGLFSRALGQQVRTLLQQQRLSVGGEVTFAYVGGPRTKTAAENRLLAKLGAHVNSMTVGPEVVLANELEIPTAALVIGHKYSLPDCTDDLDQGSIRASLERSQQALEDFLCLFLTQATPVAFANRIYRFDAHTPRANS